MRLEPLVYFFLALVLAALVLFFALGRARAHEQWANGSLVPSWVKSSCCGDADVRHVKPDDVIRKGNGDWVVTTVPVTIPSNKAQPSEDGDYWLFVGYSSGAPFARCFFVPMAF